MNFSILFYVKRVLLQFICIVCFLDIMSCINTMCLLNKGIRDTRKIKLEVIVEEIVKPVNPMTDVDVNEYPKEVTRSGTKGDTGNNGYGITKPNIGKKDIA